MRHCEATLAWCVLVLLFPVSMASIPTGCPAGCQCVDPGAGRGMTIKCLFADSIPEYWPQNTRQIEMRFTHFPKGGIPAKSFANLKGVRSIILKGLIGTIHENAFYNLTGVYSKKTNKATSVLGIWSANINKIKLGAFYNVKYFNFMLSQSRVTIMEPWAFTQFSQAVHFRLKDVKVMEVNERVFAGVHHMEAFCVLNTDVEVLYNYAFADVANIGRFNTSHFDVTMCMGKYAFAGMKKVARIDFTSSHFPAKPALRNSEGGYRLLECSNGWTVPESSLWFYRSRVKVSLILMFIVLGLVAIVVGACCIHHRRKHQDDSSSASSVSLETTDTERQHRAFGRWFSHLLHGGAHRGHGSSGQPRNPLRRRGTEEIPITTRLPSYADVMKLAPAYYNGRPLPQTPPPAYHNSALDLNETELGVPNESELGAAGGSGEQPGRSTETTSEVDSLSPSMVQPQITESIRSEN